MQKASQHTQTKKAVSGLQADRLSSTLALDARVDSVKGVSAARASALKKRHIYTVRDLLTTFPRRYIDLSGVETIRSSKIEESCTIFATIYELKLKKPKPKLSLVEITVVDDTGMMIVTCFRQPWLMNSLQKGMKLAVSGKVEFNYGYKRMINPFIERLEAGQDGHDGLILPVHPACEVISTAQMRQIMRNALDACIGMFDPLPLEIREKYHLMSRQHALEAMHFPHSMDDVIQAKRRLVYEEVFMLELSLMQETEHLAQTQQATTHCIDGPALTALFGQLPFALTEDQINAVSEILEFMNAPRRMNHMLLGDVGTGKTIVAAFALVAAADSGNQALMMAPTEVLAQQYANSLGTLLDVVGISWALLSGSTPATQREDILQKLNDGSLSVLFGTHALLEPDVQPAQCSLLIIDEQQRFGVEQRSCLLAKSNAPDALYLTATPIPRSLALALFGNLSLSYLRQRPHNTATRTTTVYAREESDCAYHKARAALERGEQVYVVCPLIDSKPAIKPADSTQGQEEVYEYASISVESEDDFEQSSMASAKKKAQMLRDTIFYGFEVGVLHGRLPGKEKVAIMDQFRNNEINVLVSTTVIEVGVDVPNATVMIIEDADRFGLSQLHQLRGRVGRGTLPAEIFLISSSKNETALQRLSAMETTEDGFELATHDLSLRREGDILGNRQHGASTLKLVNVVRDGQIIAHAHEDARALLKQDVLLEQNEHKALGREIRQMQAKAHAVTGG